MKTLIAVAVVAASLCTARGELLPFTSITTNDVSGNAQATGESQLSLEVTPTAEGRASLVFRNAGPEDAVITGIYFDFAPELNLSIALGDSVGDVNFRQDFTKPENLPGGLLMENTFVADVSAAARSPKPYNGINSYESLELYADYNGAYDLLSALEEEIIRIGVHVQGFTGGYSESFINLPDTQITVPEPSTMLLLLLGSAVLRRFRLR